MFIRARLTPSDRAPLYPPNERAHFGRWRPQASDPRSVFDAKQAWISGDELWG